MTERERWVVLKYGGTSVSSRETWTNIEAVLRRRCDEGLRPLLVCSALAGVSDGLESVLARAIHGEHEDIWRQIREKHLRLADDLCVDGEAVLGDWFQSVERLTQGAALTREVSPWLHARVMSRGELMSTSLGAAFLNARGLSSVWIDARDILRAKSGDNGNERRRILSASCCYDPDDEIRDRLATQISSVVVTQGFIARDDLGRTVLLGRGGSDTSAAYLAALLRAERCEIWTDVPGVYTARPGQVFGARLLKRLDYEEAQEITAMGAKVLHPRCLAPVRQYHIPLYIKCTTNPDEEGTVIADQAASGVAQVKAISSKRNVTLISLESQRMWQEVGFLADVFACFKRHGISVDLVSTSETNVTVTLDHLYNALDETVLGAVVADLQKLGVVRRIGGCAMVSIVGRNIRTILHQIGPSLEVFEEAKVHLVTQAANDLNLSFVVDESKADRLVERLHHHLFEHHRNDAYFGPTWEERSGTPASAAQAPTAWWRERRTELLALAERGTPLYVYAGSELAAAASELRQMKSVGRIFYSVKANAHPEILALFAKLGFGFECVSPGEVEHVQALFPDLDPGRILFTPNFAPRDEYAFGFARGVTVTLDNIFPLEQWPEVFAEREIFVRIDPGRGRGHHKFVKTGGTLSKFGVPLDQVDRLAALARANGTVVRGLHAHTGSGILSAENWQQTASVLADLTEKLPDVRVLDLGGGLGVVEKPGQIALDLREVDARLAEVTRLHPNLSLWLEPGRFLVAHAGVLLASVTQLKQKDDFRYVGVDTGMNSLIRPALYGAYHHIVNLTRLDEGDRVQAEIVGPICETGDVLGHGRTIDRAQPGDVLLVATVGAYGRAMSSNYNLRPPAAEVFLP